MQRIRGLAGLWDRHRVREANGDNMMDISGYFSVNSCGDVHYLNGFVSSQQHVEMDEHVRFAFTVYLHLVYHGRWSISKDLPV